MDVDVFDKGFVVREFVDFVLDGVPVEVVDPGGVEFACPFICWTCNG